MAKIKTPEHYESLPTNIAHNVTNLVTSSFGLVVALAWNDVIQTAVDEFIKPTFGKSGGLVSLFLYAVLVTSLAIILMTELTQLQNRLEAREEKADESS
jgi:hypothetical protein